MVRQPLATGLVCKRFRMIFNASFALRDERGIELAMEEEDFTYSHPQQHDHKFS